MYTETLQEPSACTMKHMENLVWQMHIAQEHSETGPDRPSYPSDILAGFSVYTELVEALTFPPTHTPCDPRAVVSLL